MNFNFKYVCKPQKKLLFMKRFSFILLLINLLAVPFLNAENVTGLDKDLYMQQGITITGTITDDFGEPLPGAAIIVKGTSTGMVSDANGKYSISVPNSDAILVFSFIGFSSKEIPVRNQTVINITLSDDAQLIEEVVVVGYGSMKKRDFTGAVTSVSAQTLQNEMPRTVQDLLKGNVTGLTVGFSTSAQGGGDFEIRGNNRLLASGSSGNTSPLLVVDGVIYSGSITDINPYDIQKVDVLKDASSAAVFGAKAANGVILITTTKSGQNTRKAQINFSANLQVATPGKMAHVYGPYDFIEWRQDVLRSLNWYGSGSDKLYKFDNPNHLPSGISMDMWLDGNTGDPESIWLSRIGLRQLEIDNYKAGKYIDWEKEVYKNGLNQDYNVSVSGKKDDVTYYWSLNYTDNDGIVRGDFYKTYRSRLSFDFDVTKWLTVGVNAAFTQRNESAYSADRGQIRNNSPWGNKYEDDGETLRHSPIDDPQVSVNPLYSMSHINQEVTRRRINANMYGLIKLPYNITFQTTYTPYFDLRDRFIHNSSKHVDYQAQGGRASRLNSTTFNWQIDNLLKWSQVFNNIHRVDATFLFNAEKNQYWENEMTGSGFSPSDVLGFHAMRSASLVTITSNDTYSTANALMGRLYYSLKDRYMLTATIRRDGYSAFGIRNPYGTFPSIGLGWVFTDESFLQNDLFYGKLRYTWGHNGNRDIGIYAALSDMSVDKMPYASPSGSAYESVLLYINNMANHDLKWENTKSHNIGLDYDIKSGFITGSFEVYDSRTFDLLVSRALPNVTGYGSVASNLGEVQNKGFEFNIGARLLNTKDFSWKTTFNFFLNRNKILHLYGDMEDILDSNGNVIGQKESSDVNRRWFIGEALDRIWQPKILGIWQQDEAEAARVYQQYPGDFKIQDLNNDGRISQEDNVFQGYTLPRFRWNMRHEFTLFKNFNLSFNLYSYWGHFGNYNDIARGLGKSDRSSSVKHPYWTPETPYKQNYARIDTYMSGSGATVYRKKSFVRLDNLSLSYRVPSHICNILDMQSMTVLASARNVFVWAPDWDYGDPEVDGGNPAPKYFSIGVNITF